MTGGRESYNFPDPPTQGASKLWQEKPIGIPAPSPFQHITIKELYLLIWKIAIASFLFAVPFLIIYALVAGRI